MKKQLCSIFASAILVVTLSVSAKAQGVSTFENLSLSTSSYWDGSASPLGATFKSGHAIFPNYYDTSYGGYWVSGWAYSNMQDSTTAGYTNMFSSRSAGGYNGSANYAVGTQAAMVYPDSGGAGKVMYGVYINNGTYAALSMKNGDFFAKKFGDTTGTSCHCTQGTYPDWFKLTIRNWFGGVMTNDSVTFYLADYRFGIDTAKDYIVSKWQWVDLTSLGNTDSLQFNLSSSDNGSFGMNTPAYFCIDNFTTTDSPAGILNLPADNSAMKVYPNPANNMVNVDLSMATDKNMKLEIADVTGQVVYSGNVNSPSIVPVDMSTLANGVYFIKVTGANTTMTKKLVKE